MKYVITLRDGTRIDHEGRIDTTTYNGHIMLIADEKIVATHPITAVGEIRSGRIHRVYPST